MTKVRCDDVMTRDDVMILKQVMMTRGADDTWCGHVGFGQQCVRLQMSVSGEMSVSVEMSGRENDENVRPRMTRMSGRE